MRRVGHGAVVAVLSGDIEKGGAQDVGTFGAHDLDEARHHAVAAPAPHRLVARLGEAEVEDRVVGSLAQPVEAHVQPFCRALHLGGADRAQVAGHRAADVVLSALAAVGAGIGDGKPVAKAQRRQHVRGFVVGMRARLQEAHDRAQRAQRLPQIDDGGFFSRAPQPLRIVQRHWRRPGRVGKCVMGRDLLDTGVCHVQADP